MQPDERLDATPGAPPGATVGTSSGRWLVGGSSLLWGLLFSFLTPTLAMLLVALYGASLAEVGWVLSVYNAAGFVASLVIPAWADRRRNYATLMAASAASAVLLAAALWLVHGLDAATLALVVLGAPAGVGSSLLFAHLRDAGAKVRDVTSTRAVMSFSWVVGPPLATAVMGGFGARSILLVIGAVALANVGLSLVLRRHAGRREAAGLRAEPSSQPPARKLLVAVVLAAFVLLQSTNVATVSVMTLFVTGQLHRPAFWAGLALGVCAACEIPCFWLVGRQASRHSQPWLVVLGCLVGVVYHAVVAVAPHPWVLVAMQLPNAYFIAVVSAIGLTWFQELVPGAGLASGLFLNARRVGAVLAGPVIALGAASPLGQAGVFAVCAVLTAAGGAVVGAVGWRQRRSRLAARQAHGSAGARR